ncbi:unnamed protein product [Umbelopsis ramanniana]
MPDKQKTAQTSRKGKKAWRKNIDIQDVEEHLEQVRSEERSGGKISERSDDKLFMINVKGDDRVKRQLAKDKPLYIEKILESRSAIPPVGTRLFSLPKTSPKEKGKESKANNAKIDKLAKRKLTHPEPTKPAKKSKGTAYDVWADEEPTTVELNPYLEPVHKRKVNAPATLKVKPAAAVHLPAVQVADAGASYNPTMEDHQALLRKANQVEEDKIAERERINKQLEYRKELLEMDDDEVAKTDDEEEEDSDVHSDDDEETRKRKEIRKKTRTERNRLRRAKENKWLEDRRRREKALNKELHKLDEIQQMVVDIEQETEEKTRQRQERQEAKEKAGLPRLGKYYVPKAPIEVQLTEELSESLRTLKPEGNAFKDRFNSLQKRNIIEPRVPVAPKRRYKLKEYEKHSYKQFDRANNKNKK